MQKAQTGVLVFSTAEVMKIRAEWDGGTIRVRDWADAKGCSPETVRKVGRRDTYRGVREGGGEPSKRKVYTPDEGLELLPLDDAGAQGSLARLQAELDRAPISPRGVDGLLDELTREGANRA